MSTAAKFALVTGNGPSVAWRVHPRVEKASASNASYGERRDYAAHTVAVSPTRTRETLSQIETTA
jgi:hypothetical protein